MLGGQSPGTALFAPNRQIGGVGFFPYFSSPQGLLSVWTQLLTHTIIPVLAMFALERSMMRFLIHAPWGKAWVRSRFWLQPNFISLCRYPMGIISVLIFQGGYWWGDGTMGNAWQHAGIMWFTFWIITDITDGTIARHFELHSEKGEIIDPLSDKLLLFPPLFYYCYLGYLPLWLVGVFLSFDLVGQFSRFFIPNKAANLFGKAKTFLTVITIVLVTFQIVYFGGEPWRLSESILKGAVALAFCSMFFKIIPNYWYANLLSILNLFCGLVGIMLVLEYNKPSYAFAAVFLGQFLDLFDGRAADKWGSTPKGEYFDDLADGTNFGGTISFIIWASLGKGYLALALGILHFGTTSYRLIRFLADKKEAGVESGVQVFKGLPSPAAALIAGSIALTHGPDWVKVLVILGTSLLMISKVPFIHFGRVILPSIPKFFQVIILTLILLAVLAGFSTGNLPFLYWLFFSISFSYLIFGYDWSRHKSKEAG